MTNKEAREIIKSECYIFNPLDFDRSTRINTALDIAIKAIEEPSINETLDKVRAEIADLDDTDYDFEGYYKAITDALQILDKYRAEMERAE